MNRVKFQFHGSIQVDEGTSRQFELLPQLDSRVSEIEEEIETRLERLLPDSSSVNADIKFHEGSIEFSGMIDVIIWMGALGGAIQFAAYVRDAVEHVLRRALNNALRSANLPPVPTTVGLTVYTVATNRARTFLNWRDIALATPVALLAAVVVLLTVHLAI